MTWKLTTGAMRRRGSTTLVAGALAAAGAAATAPVAGAATQPLSYTFTKTCTLGAISVCHGSAAGDVNGALTSIEQPGTWWSDGIAHVTFVDTLAGETMRVSGIFNTNSLRVVMNGRVTDGPNRGARTHHSASVVAFAAGPDGPLAIIEGSGSILPGSAR